MASADPNGAPPTRETFDPSKHLRRLGKGDYLEVKWRLLWFRTDHPDGVVETEMVKHDLGLREATHPQPMAVFRARVAYPYVLTYTRTDGTVEIATDGTGSPIVQWAAAVGYGQEEQKDFPDYLEKAETKALGRALAALGYGTQFTEEVEIDDAAEKAGKKQSIADSPVERERGRTQSGNNRGDHRGTGNRPTAPANAPSRPAERVSAASANGPVPTHPANPAVRPAADGRAAANQARPPAATHSGGPPITRAQITALAKLETDRPHGLATVLAQKEYAPEWRKLTAQQAADVIRAVSQLGPDAPAAAPATGGAVVTGTTMNGIAAAPTQEKIRGNAVWLVGAQQTRAVKSKEGTGWSSVDVCPTHRSRWHLTPPTDAFTHPIGGDEICVMP